MNKNINQITEITKKIQTTDNIYDFDNIELPFELLSAVIIWLDSTFSPSKLQDLAKNDPETLDAWAIALNKTLPNLLTMLKRWKDILSLLPIPSKLQEKITEKIAEIEEINQNKSALMSQYEQLFNQEKILRESQEELSNLQQKKQALETIEQELRQVNLTEFANEVDAQGKNIEPKQVELDKLKQKKAETEILLQELKELEEQLENEIEVLNKRQSRLEKRVMNTTKDLINKINNKSEGLNDNCSQLLQELAEKQQEFESVKEKLQTAVKDFNQYETKTQEMEYHLKTHYQYNQELAGLLPMDPQRIDTLINQIKEMLTAFDLELTKAQKEHEASQQQLKRIITF